MLNLVGAQTAPDTFAAITSSRAACESLGLDSKIVAQLLAKVWKHCVKTATARRETLRAKCLLIQQEHSMQILDAACQVYGLSHLD